jgi:hypothetical protein
LTEISFSPRRRYSDAARVNENWFFAQAHGADMVKERRGVFNRQMPAVSYGTAFHFFGWLLLAKKRFKISDLSIENWSLKICHSHPTEKSKKVLA